MITNAVRLLIICVFAFVPLLLGEFARNKAVNNTNDFILQGRKLKTFPMYATIFSTWMSIFAFIGAIAYFYEQGPIYMTTVGWDALFAVLFILLGRRIWHYGKVHNYMTPTDFFDDIYDSKKLNVLVTVVSILSTMVYLQVQIVGGILVMNVATAGVISSYVGGIIFFSILVIYLWAGGLRAVVRTDIFYGILIVLAIVSSGLYLMHVAGGTGQVFPELIAKDPSYVSMPGEEGRHRVVLWISLFFIVPIGAFMGPQIWIRNYAAESERNFNVIPWLLCLSSIICVGTLFAGSSALVLTDHVDNPDSILLTLLHQYANPFFYTFVIIGIYATIFSTANSQVHAIAAVYTIDVHKRYINRKTPERKLVDIAKWTVLIVALVSYVFIIIVPQSIFDLGIIALGVQAQLIVPVAGAFFWKRSTASAAYMGILSGELTFLVGLVLSGGQDSSICAIAGLIANLFFFIIMAMTDKPRIRVYKKIETYRREYKLKNY